MNNIYHKNPWTIISIIFIISLISIWTIHSSFNLGYKMTTKHSTLIDTTIKAKLEITQSHLWLEEFISGDNNVDKLTIIKHIEKARWYLNAMLNGGKNQKRIIVPIDLNNKGLRYQIEAVIRYLDRYYISATKSRMKNKDTEGISSEADIKYDKLYQAVMSKIDDVETILEATVSKDIQTYLLIEKLLIFAIVIINLFIFFSYKIILRSETKWLTKHFKLEDKNSELEKINVKLEQAQAMIDKYIPISETDLDGNITYINDAMSKLTGYTKDELIGKNHRILRCQTCKKETYKELWRSIIKNKFWGGELRNIDKYGKQFWVNAHIHPIYNKDKDIIGYQALRENITDKKDLEFLAAYDKLTTVYNRNKFDEVFEYEIEQYKRYKNKLSLAIFDIDNFKNINDTYGHLAGDHVLIQCADIIKNSIRESDVLARWGGEEFVILFTHTKADEAKIVAEKIRKSIEEFLFDTVENVTISCGLSEISDNDTANTFLKRADSALYQAKHSGKNKVITKV